MTLSACVRYRVKMCCEASRRRAEESISAHGKLKGVSVIAVSQKTESEIRVEVS